jgi:glycerate 2-kinase
MSSNVRSGRNAGGMGSTLTAGSLPQRRRIIRTKVVGAPTPSGRKRTLIAIDKFKGALSAHEACGVAGNAIRSVRGTWAVDLCPLSDGGEGFVTILTTAASGRLYTIHVLGPRGQRVKAKYGVVKVGNVPAAALAMLNVPNLAANASIGIVELAQASGLALLSEDMRDPWKASTLGTGQVIQGAVEKGVSAIVVGVGGSATHDLGVGALSVLGIKFLNCDKKLLASCEPEKWPKIASIGRSARASVPPIRIACDVTNPLLGRLGSVRTYCRQKGLPEGACERMEDATSRMSALICRHFGQNLSFRRTPGAGAAGGFSFGFACALGAALVCGSDLVSAWLNLDERLRAADTVVTGEGRFDRSSYMGKAPGRLIHLALKMGKPVHVFAGQAMAMHSKSGLHVHVIADAGTEVSKAMRQSKKNLDLVVRRVFARGWNGRKGRVNRGVTDNVSLLGGVGNPRARKS